MRQISSKYLHPKQCFRQIKVYDITTGGIPHRAMADAKSTPSGSSGLDLLGLKSKCSE